MPAPISAALPNAAKLMAPTTTVAGPEASRRHAPEPGSTGERYVVPVEDAEEVAQRFAEFRRELQPSGALATTLVRRAATMAVRMERCSEREIAATTERVIQAIADCEIPEDAEPAEVHRLRTEAGRLAAFDTSREGILARRYEASAERSFFRALKEFRLVEKSVRGVEPARPTETLPSELGSFSQISPLDPKLAAPSTELGQPNRENRLDSVFEEPWNTFGGRIDVPITIGRAR